MGAENFSRKSERCSKTRKEKVAAPLSKVVIRKLPPTFSEEEFREAIAPVPENNYFSFVGADNNLGQHAFARAYISFDDVEEIFNFRDKFDGYIFVDQKGNEYPAIVEYAPFPKVPKPASQLKKDARCGTILEDTDYLSFLESLENPEAVPVHHMETLLEEIEAKERELKANNGVLRIKTPLIEYVEQRGLDRMRGIDRKRRKELDRRRARDEERKRRREAREFRKRDEPHREDRGRKVDDDRVKRDEEKYRSGNVREKERTSRRNELIDDHQVDEKRNYSKIPKEPAAEVPKSKRYSEGRKKDDGEKRKVTPSKDKTVLKSHIIKTEPTHSSHGDGEKLESAKNKTEKSPTSTENSVKEKGRVVIQSPHSKKDKSDESFGQSHKSEKSAKLDESPTKANKRSEKRESSPASTNDRKSSAGSLPKQSSPDESSERFTSPSEQEISVKMEETSKYESSTENLVQEIDDLSEKESRPARRIRNKDRPAMQLYRPGQSRLSERAKSAKSQVSSSSSPSPTLDEEEVTKLTTDKDDTK